MNFVLRLKHWQVFLFLILGLYLNNIRITDNLTLTTILSVTGGIIYFSWIPIVGLALHRQLGEEIELNYKLFVVNSIIWLTSYTFLTILNLQTHGTDFPLQTTFSVTLILTFYSALYYYMFPARVLKSIERNEKVRTADCIWDFLLFAFLPIGIWTLQSRINKVTTDRDDKLVK